MVFVSVSVWQRFLFPADISGINWAMMPLALGDAIYIALDQPPGLDEKRIQIKEIKKPQKKLPKKKIFMWDDFWRPRWLLIWQIANFSPLTRGASFSSHCSKYPNTQILRNSNIQIWQNSDLKELPLRR